MYYYLLYLLLAMKRTMFSVAALMSLLAAVAFTACSEEGDPNGQTDASLSENDSIYTPPANLSSADIAALMEKANAALAEEKFTVTGEDAEGNERILFGVHLSAQKVFEVWTAWDDNTAVDPQGNDVISEPRKSNGWSYIEGTMEYRYVENSTTSSDIGKKESWQIDDAPAFWDRVAEEITEAVAGVFTHRTSNQSTQPTWAVSGNAFVTTVEEKAGEPCTYTVTLTADKKFKTVKGTFIGTGNTHEYAYSYGVDISMPSGFDKSDFTPRAPKWATPNRLRLHWGLRTLNPAGSADCQPDRVECE
jgi:hypothetical protein